MNWDTYQSKIEPINHPLLSKHQIHLSILREDLIHPAISGNKYRKLKYNILAAQRLGYQKVLTFGGAFSNHIAATAAAAHQNNLAAIGIIRGEELEPFIAENPTLAFAQSKGMELKFISREAYRNKDSEAYLAQLKAEYPDCYVIPEGGTNALAIQGCEEILHEACQEYEYIATSIGTAGTIAGILNSTTENQHVLGFPSLKGDFFSQEISKLTSQTNYTILPDYHFGGYGKVSEELINFINSFKKQTTISLDPLYTGKMLFGIFDLIQQEYFSPHSKLLAIHTGGLQGIEGMNKLLAKKNKTMIQ